MELWKRGREKIRFASSGTEEQHGAVLEVEERNAAVRSAENDHTVQKVVCDHRRYGKSVFSLCMHSPDWNCV